MPQLILADKSDLFRRSMTSVLAREGYEVIAADAGSKVLTLVSATRPSAIILDTEVEDPSGLETLAKLKSDPQFRKLPVLVVSRNSAPTAVSAAFRIGAEGFLVKPVDLNQLLKTLASLRVPIPHLNAPIEVRVGARKLVGTLRFIDQYGQVYLDKSKPDLLGALGSMGVMTFEAERLVYRQAIMLDDENDQGLSLLPVGAATTKETPELGRVSSAMKCRYLIAGSFVRLADVAELSPEGLVVRNLNAEPRFNADVDLTLFPHGTVGDGLALKGRIEGFRAGAEAGMFEADVRFAEPPGLPYVHLLAELMHGRPRRSTPQEAK